MRILYLGHARMSAANATGQTLRALYDCHESQDVLEIVSQVQNSDPQFTGLVVPPFSSLTQTLVRSLKARSSSLRDSGSHFAPPAGLNDSIPGASLSVRQRIGRECRALLDFAPVRLQPDFIARVRAFRPEVIHSLLGNVRQMKLAVALSHALNIPIVPHFMDDWVNQLYADGELVGAARVQMNRVLDRVIERSPVLLCIGEAMAEEYSARFGRPAFVARYGVAASDAEPGRRANGGNSRRLVYAGGLHLGRADVLVTVADALLGTGWSIDLYSRSGGFEHDNVRVLPPVSPVEVHEVLARADALLFVESFESSIASFTRLSVSTKVSEYMAAKRPVVIMGPEGQASVTLLARTVRSVMVLTSLAEFSRVQLINFLNRAANEESQDLVTPAELTLDSMQRSMLRSFELARESWAHQMGEVR